VNIGLVRYLVKRKLVVLDLYSSYHAPIYDVGLPTSPVEEFESYSFLASDRIVVAYIFRDRGALDVTEMDPDPRAII
jgi:hypothetical protein